MIFKPIQTIISRSKFFLQLPATFKLNVIIIILDNDNILNIEKLETRIKSKIPIYKHKHIDQEIIIIKLRIEDHDNLEAIFRKIDEHLSGHENYSELSLTLIVYLLLL